VHPRSGVVNKSNHRARLKQSPVADMSDGVPPTRIDPCCGKRKFQSEKEARDFGFEVHMPRHQKFEVYSCIWCDGWHLSLRGKKGSDKRLRHKGGWR
jgi:hypothetical protein